MTRSHVTPCRSIQCATCYPHNFPNQARRPVSAEFRLSDEQRAEVGRFLRASSGLYAAVEHIVASEVEAARAKWEAQAGRGIDAAYRIGAEAAERALVERIEAVLADVERVGFVNGEHLTDLRALTRPDGDQ